MSRARRTPRGAALAAALALVPACGGSSVADGPARADAATAPPPTVTIAAAPDGGGVAAGPAEPASLYGVVHFLGFPPERRPVKMAGCGSHDEPTLDDRVLVQGGRLQNVFVELARGLRGYDPPPPPEEPVRLDQQGCMYSPRVVAVRVGQRLEVHNADPLNHNVHLFAQRASFPNNTQPPGSAPFEFVFEKKEPRAVVVGCDIHPWMRSNLHVVDHPFFAITGADGTFLIEGIPPGDYTFTAWHEKYGQQSVALELDAGSTARVDFSFQAD